MVCGMRIFSPVASILFIYSLVSICTVFGREAVSEISFKDTQASDKIEVQAYLGWESRYLSEGRDELDGDSLYVSSFELSWKNLVGGIWYGSSPDQNYDELELSLALTHSIGDFEFYVGYSHIRFPFENEHEDELATGLVWSGLSNGIELSADITYSFETDGFFLEFSAGREFEITDQLSLSIAVPFAINQGFVDDGHEGANNIAIQMGLEYALSKSLSLTAHTTYSWALDRDSSLPGDEQLIDFFHGGIGLKWSF